MSSRPTTRVPTDSRTHMISTEPEADMFSQRLSEEDDEDIDNR